MNAFPCPVILCCLLLVFHCTGLLADDAGTPRDDYRRLGYRLHHAFRCHSQGIVAGSLVDLGDGRIITLDSVDGGTVRVSEDDGETWTQIATMYEGEGPGRLIRDMECAIALRTHNGVIIWVYRDFEGWRWKWDEETGEAVDPVLTVWSIRSLDGGETWTDRQMVFDGYCGSMQDIIQTREGRVVLPVQRYLPNPGRHAMVTYSSDDEGKTWRRSNLIDLGGHGHHDGAMEATLTELADGRLLMLLRTGLDRFWKAYSYDGGLTWRQVEPSDIPASNAPGFVLRLESGRLALVWNRLSPGREMRPLLALRPDGPRRGWGTELPADGWRNALSIALSEDDGETWSEPLELARGPRLCYPQVREHRPGELWISFVAGSAWTRNLVRVTEDDLLAALQVREGEGLRIVAFGDSTTAPRGSVVIYPMLVEWALEDLGVPVRIINAGRGSDTTVMARERFEADVLEADPQIVIIQFGLNDAAVDVWRNVTVPRVSADDYEANLEELVTRLQGEDIPVILMTPNPVRWTERIRGLYGKPPYDPEDPDGYNVLLPEYAERVRRVAARHGVPLADVWAAFRAHGEVEGQSVDELMMDGMHPGDLGHEIVADLLMEHIRGLLPAAD